mmetsp:Transcript_91000/g.141903  ORF Transcript_91000/g.141903 Transcript_91000/m.141903 type:complete len:376 (+) Transcript_91000:68-1195(+)
MHSYFNSSAFALCLLHVCLGARSFTRDENQVSRSEVDVIANPVFLSKHLSDPRSVNCDPRKAFANVLLAFELGAPAKHHLALRSCQSAQLNGISVRKSRPVGLADTSKTLDLDEEDEAQLRAIVEEEEGKRAPNRKWYILGSLVAILLSLLSGAASVASLTNNPELLPFESENLLLFDSAAITLAVDLVFGGTGAFIIYRQFVIREESIQEIMDAWKVRKIQQKYMDGEFADKKKSETKSVSKKVARGFGKEPLPPPVAAPPSTTESSKDKAEDNDDKAEENKGWTGGSLVSNVKAMVRDTYGTADIIARNNAIALNAKLEEAGVLPPINPKAAKKDGTAETKTASAEERTDKAKPAPVDSKKPQKKKKKQRRKK